MCVMRGSRKSEYWNTCLLVCQTLTSVKGTLCCAVEVSVSTLRAASSAFAPWATRSPLMARPAWVSNGVVSTSVSFFASIIFVSFVVTGNMRTFVSLKQLLLYLCEVLQVSCSIQMSKHQVSCWWRHVFEALCDPIRVLQAQLFALFLKLCSKNNQSLTEVTAFIISAEGTCFRIVVIINCGSESDWKSV